jgi:acetylornithine deacetylase/succinyl-diaminopimelate desuccinylase-like protein
MRTDPSDGVDAARLQRLTLELTRIRSYTGESREMAECYAQELRDAGLSVEIYRDSPQAPCVVARLRGTGAGRTLTLNGHLDTVPLEHPVPYLADGRVYGRGAADMKGGLAAMAEAARLLAASGIRLTGDLLLIAHSLHEAPGGHGQDLTELVRRGIKGDAAIIAEVASDALPIVGLGQCMFEFTAERPGEPTHELLTPSGTPHPILAVIDLANLIRARQAELALQPPLPFIGHESYFFGIVQGGDFYNRWPVTCRLVGTRRYGPDSTLAVARAELEELARRVEATTGARVSVEITPVRDGFRLTEEEPLVGMLRQAYATVTGRELPLTGIRMVGDAAIFTREGGIPALYHGPGGQGAHADLESVAVADLVRAARVYVRTAMEYLGVEGG